MTAFDRVVGLRLLSVHQFIYELSGGRIGGHLGRTPMLLLRTTGRKTGHPRTVALLYHRDGDHYVVVGSKGGSDARMATQPECHSGRTSASRHKALSRQGSGGFRGRATQALVGGDKAVSPIRSLPVADSSLDSTGHPRANSICASRWQRPSVTRPVLELKSFVRIELEAGA
jgi:hypothetical protein